MTTATSPTLLVLAAGMGSRYGGLKQIEPVGPSGETIIDYSIYDAMRAGFGKLVFVIRKDIEEPFKEVVGARFERRIAVDYVFQELDKIPAEFQVPAGRTKPWGTTQAILMTADVIHEPFAVINADDFYGAESYRVLAQQLQSGSPDYAMVGFVLRNTLSDFGTVARGVCKVSDDGYLKAISELTAIGRDGAHAKNTDGEGKVTMLTGDEPVSMNFWGFTPQVFGQLGQHFKRFLEANGGDLKKECYIPSTVNDIMVAGQGKVKVLHSNDSWFGVTYRQDHEYVVDSIKSLVKAGTYPESLWG
jgi:hypothetical protein